MSYEPHPLNLNLLPLWALTPLAGQVQPIKSL